MNSPIILRAEERDLKVLNTISVQSKMYWGYPEEWLQLWVDDLTVTSEYLNKNHVFKLQLNDEIIGFVALAGAGQVFEVDHLWVLPPFIGKGYGKMLLKEVIDRVVAFGAEVFVIADPNAESFYKSQGFVSYDVIESTPPGRFLPKMKKKV